MGNAAQDMLWSELTNQGHLDLVLDKSLSIKSIMDTWTLKKGIIFDSFTTQIFVFSFQIFLIKGYPVINVKNLGNGSYALSQKWFLLNPLSKLLNTPQYKSYKWFVPFTFTTKHSLKFEFESRPIWLIPSEEKSKQNQTFQIIQL